MPKLTFITHDDRPYAVEIESGTSAMEAAVRNGVPGIDGDCGGAAACGTCHVYVDPDWQDRAGPAAGTEASMVAYIDNAQPNSRLACQITLTDALDGLVLRMPAAQH